MSRSVLPGKRQRLYRFPLRKKQHSLYPRFTRWEMGSGSGEGFPGSSKMMGVVLPDGRREMVAAGSYRVDEKVRKIYP